MEIHTYLHQNIVLIHKTQQYYKHIHLAIQQTNNIRFCHIENDNLIAFYKWNQDRSDVLLIVISLDPYYTQQGKVQMPLNELGLKHDVDMPRAHTSAPAQGCQGR